MFWSIFLNSLALIIGILVIGWAKIKLFVALLARTQIIINWRITMEEVVVTKLWMAGVVGAMVVFGVIAFIGYLKQSNSNQHKD